MAKVTIRKTKPTIPAGRASDIRAAGKAPPVTKNKPKTLKDVDIKRS